MERNKYIYCLSDAAVVVCSTPEKGGTWAGADKNLKKKWVPLWVKKTSDSYSGNPNLEKKGAKWLPEAFGQLEAEDGFQELGDAVTVEALISGESTTSAPKSTEREAQEEEVGTNVRVGETKAASISDPVEMEEPAAESRAGAPVVTSPRITEPGKRPEGEQPTPSNNMGPLFNQSWCSEGQIMRRDAGGDGGTRYGTSAKRAK